MHATQIQLREMQVVGTSTREWIVHHKECPSLAHLGIRYAGLSQVDSEFTFCRLAPNVAVVFGCLAGEGQVWVRGAWKTCAAGETYIAPAGATHAYHAVKGRKWHLCWVAYEDAADRRTVIPHEQPSLFRDSSQGLRNAIMGLYEEVHGLNETSMAYRWTELVDSSARRLIHGREIDDRLLALWKAVDTDLARPWTLALLAKRVHLSPEQLRHLCRKHFGHSPMKHLTSLRMKRASVLLVRTNQKIAAIASAVGYENAFAFSTAFKRVTGTSPLKFLRTHRGSGAMVGSIETPTALTP